MKVTLSYHIDKRKVLIIDLSNIKPNVEVSESKAEAYRTADCLVCAAN